MAQPHNGDIVISTNSNTYGMYSVVIQEDTSPTSITVRTTKSVIDAENYFQTTSELSNTPDISVEIPLSSITEYQTPLGAKVSKLAMATYVDSKFINNTSGKITYWEIRKILIDLIFSTYNRQDEMVLTTGILPLGNREGQLLSWNYDLECWRIYDNRVPSTFPWAPSGQSPSNPSDMGPEVLVTAQDTTPISYPFRQAMKDWFPYQESDLNYATITNNLNRSNLLTKLATGNLLYELINQSDSITKKQNILAYLNRDTQASESLILAEVGQQAILDKLDTPYNPTTNPLNPSTEGVNSGILYYLGRSTIADFLGTDYLLNYFGRQSMLNFLNGGANSSDGYSDGYNKVGSSILDTIGLTEIRRFLDQQATLTWLDTPITTTQPSTDGYITNDPIIQTISRDELMQSINRSVADGVDSKLYQLNYLGQQTILDFLDIHYGIIADKVLRLEEDFTLQKLDINKTYNRIPENSVSGFKLETTDLEMTQDLVLAWKSGNTTLYSSLEFVPGSTVDLYADKNDVFEETRASGHTPAATKTLTLDSNNLISFYRYICKETNEEIWLDSTTPTSGTESIYTYICPSETLTTYQIRSVEVSNIMSDDTPAVLIGSQITEVVGGQTRVYVHDILAQGQPETQYSTVVRVAPVKLDNYTRDIEHDDSVSFTQPDLRTISVLFINAGSSYSEGKPISQYVSHSAADWLNPNRNFDIIHSNDRMYRMSSMVTRIYGDLAGQVQGQNLVSGINTLDSSNEGYVFVYASSYGNGDVEFQIIKNGNETREQEILITHFTNLLNLGYRGFNTGLVRIGQFEGSNNIIRQIYTYVTSDELSYYRGTITGVSRTSIRKLQEGNKSGPHYNDRFPCPNNSYTKIIIPYGFELLFDTTGFVGFDKEDYVSVFISESEEIDLPTELLDEEGNPVIQKAAYLVAKITESAIEGQGWLLNFEWRDELVEGSDSKTVCMLGSAVLYKENVSDPVRLVPNSWLFYPWLSITSQEERVNSGVKIQSGSPTSTDTDDQGDPISTLQINVNAGRIQAEGIQINDTSKLSYFDFDYTKNVMSQPIYPDYMTAHRPASNVWVTNLIYDTDQGQLHTITASDPEWGKWALLVPGVGPMGPEGGVFYYIPQGDYTETDTDSQSRTYHFADCIFEDIDDLWKAVQDLHYDTRATSNRFIPLPTTIAVKIGYTGVSTDTNYVQFRSDIPSQFTRFVSVSEPSSSVMRTGLSFYDNGGLVGLAYGSNAFNVSIPADSDETNDLKYTMQPATVATQVDLDMHVPRRSLIIPGTYNTSTGAFSPVQSPLYQSDTHPNTYDIYQDSTTNHMFRWNSSNNRYDRITGNIPVINPGTSGTLTYNTTNHKFELSSKLLTGSVGEVFGVVFDYSSVSAWNANFDTTVVTQQIDITSASGSATLNLSALILGNISGVVSSRPDAHANVIDRAMGGNKGIIYFVKVSAGNLQILNSLEYDSGSLPSLSGNNTWSGTNTYNGAMTVNGTATFSQVIQGTALRASYADLAEYYEADADYEAGTVVMFGGSKEITIAKEKANAIISTKPGLELNGSKAEEGNHKPIALTGRVLVKVAPGVEIKKFDSLYLSRDVPGTVTNVSYGEKLGIALASGTEKILATVQLSL